MKCFKWNSKTCWQHSRTTFSQCICLVSFESSDNAIDDYFGLVMFMMRHFNLTTRTNTVSSMKLKMKLIKL